MTAPRVHHDHHHGHAPRHAPGTGRTAVVTGIGIVTPQTMDPADGRDGDWFHGRTVLGRGYKYLPLAGQYLIAATRRALADAGTELDGVPESRRAITIGTNNGTSQLQGEFDRTVIEHHSGLLSPPSVPYFSANLIGSRVAMEHHLRGFSLGVHTPRVAGLEAIQHGIRALAAGRAGWLLTGAAEARMAPDEPGAADAEEGAVALIVETVDEAALRGAHGYGQVRVRSALLPSGTEAAGSTTGRSRRLLEDALVGLGLTGELGAGDEDADPGPGPRPAHRADSSGPPVPDTAVRARRLPVRLVSGDGPLGDRVAALLGERVTRVPARAGCLGPTLEVAALLARGTEPHLVVGVAESGNVSIARVSPAVQDVHWRHGARTSTA